MDGMPNYPTKTSMEYLIPLCSSPLMQQRYTHFQDAIRFDMVMAQLDLVAGMCSNHFLEDSGVGCVTAALDRFDVIHPIRPDNNILMRASINAVFNKSMEVGVKLTTDLEDEGKFDEKHVATAYFTMVGMRADLKTAVLPALTLSTSEQLRRSADARFRRSENNKLLSQLPPIFPSAEELEALDGLRDDHSDRHIDTILMKETVHTSEVEMYPGYVNHLGNVFGGNIMQFAYQNAYITAQAHCRAYPVLAGVDRIDFLSPVHIGDIVLLESRVVHVGKTSLSIETNVLSRDQRGSQKRLTNSCHFTFVATDENRNFLDNPIVVPTSHEEDEVWLHAHRRYVAVQERRAR